MDDRGAKGYDDKKVFRCISCGTDVLTTKFASALKVQCDDCKKDKKPADPHLLAEIEAERKGKVSARQVSEDDPSVPTDKKKSKCIQCGAEVLIGKFASHAKTLCDDCKGDDDSHTAHSPGVLKIDTSKIDREKLPEIDGIFVSPIMIGNHRLRSVACPACGHEPMKIVKIIDSNPLRGLVITYQCHKCLVAMTLSEQSIKPLTPVAEHRLFNYRGEEIMDMTETTQDVKLRNAVDYLVQLLKDHNIPIEGNIDFKKPIERKHPVGLSTVDDILKYQSNVSKILERLVTYAEEKKLEIPDYMMNRMRELVNNEYTGQDITE